MTSLRNQPAGASALPDELSCLAEQVARETRLWPGEVEDVLAELHSHFHEALEDLRQQGLTQDDCVEALRAGFGDPKLTARLIRRSKMRARPLLWKIIRRAVVVCLAGMAVTVAYAGWIAAGKPQPSVDYVDRLNEPVVSVPMDQRAWPLLRDLILDLEPMPDSLSHVRPRPGEEGWALASDWLDSNRALLPRIHQAAGRPVYGFVYGAPDVAEFSRSLAAARGRARDPKWDRVGVQEELIPPTVAMILPGLHDTRNLAKLLLYDARARASSGDLRDAWHSMNSASRLGLHLSEGATLIEQLVGAAVIAMTQEDLRWFLFRHLEDLPLADWRVGATLSGVRVRGDYAGERLMFQDVVQYLFTDDGAGNGTLIPGQFQKLAGHFAEWKGGVVSEVGALSIASVHADRRGTLAKFEEIWQRMGAFRNLPLYDSERQQGTDRIVREFNEGTLQRQRYAVIRLTLATMTRADQILRETAMHQQASELLARLIEHRSEIGAWPATLRELPGKIPLDVYSGAPLVYRTDDDDFLLYSVGRNLQDDGGSTLEVQDDYGSATADIVYWPVE